MDEKRDGFLNGLVDGLVHVVVDEVVDKDSFVVVAVVVEMDRGVAIWLVGWLVVVLEKKVVEWVETEVVGVVGMMTSSWWSLRHHLTTAWKRVNSSGMTREEWPKK